MGNNKTENENSNPPDLEDNKKQARQGENAFEQGSSNNSTNSGSSKVDEEKNNSGLHNSGNNGSSEKPLREPDKINDDEDVDEKPVPGKGI